MRNKDRYLFTILESKRDITSKKKTYRKNVWVVGKAQFLMTNSVVVTVVHVIHNETTCPARRDRVKRLVQRLINRLQKLCTKAPNDVYTMGGRLAGRMTSFTDSGSNLCFEPLSASNLCFESLSASNLCFESLSASIFCLESLSMEGGIVAICYLAGGQGQITIHPGRKIFGLSCNQKQRVG